MYIYFLKGHWIRVLKILSKFEHSCIIFCQVCGSWSWLISLLCSFLALCLFYILFVYTYVTPSSKSNRLGAPWRIHHTVRHCVPAPHLLMDFQEQYTKRYLISTAICWGINIENPSITVESGRNGVTCSGFVKVHPNGCFCSEGSHMLQWVNVSDNH